MKNFLYSLGAGVGIIIFLLLFFFGGICLHYDIGFWASQAKHHEVHPSWILCLLGGLFSPLGVLAIIVAIVTFICSYFI